MARRTLYTMATAHQGVFHGTFTSPLIPVTYAHPGLARYQVCHFIHSSTCTELPTLHRANSQPHRTDGTPITVLTLNDIFTHRNRGFTLCLECFAGPGLGDLATFAATPQAPPALAAFLFRSDLRSLIIRIDHARAGYITKRGYAAHEVPVVTRRIAATRTAHAQLAPPLRQLHATLLAAFEASAARFLALVDPSSTSYAVDTLRASLAPYTQDETPTILAVSCPRDCLTARDHLAPELIGALCVSDPTNSGVVLYGPRFAIDYLQRIYGQNSSYIMATKEPDPATAKLAASLWGTPPAGMLDLFVALATARTLLAPASPLNTT
jgi:hypothetical protein